MNVWTNIRMAAVVAALLAAAGTAEAGSSVTWPEILTDPSSVQIGCVDRCACPILMRGPLRGGFEISELQPDPLYRNFAITNFDAKVEAQPWGPEMRLTGSGTYRMGGEVALQHQLVLDLSIDGGAPRHFDSGLVPGGGDFPAIRIDVRLHPESCYDTLVAIDARPATAAIDDDGITLQLRASPNPFVGVIDLRFVLPVAARVRTEVHDLSGRRVRVLLDAVREAGAHALVWDGRDDAGSPVRAGLYFVSVRGAGRESRRTIALLR
jgi:hypothetical protein